jgi:metal-dependent amidase/aminoacylase/carboxypeptidase family protein
MDFKICLRADIDALKMKEENFHLEYRSVSNVAHMCGHDGHTTTMLGGIALILDKLDEIP